MCNTNNSTKELRKGLQNMVYNELVSLIVTTLSQPPAKQRQIMNEQEKQAPAAGTDSNDNSVQTNPINNKNVNKTNTLTSGNGSGVNYNGNGSNSGDIVSNSGSIALMLCSIKSASCSFCIKSNFNGSSINCDKNTDNNGSNSTISNCGQSCGTNCIYGI